jgi:hypothetical protein
MNDQGAEMTATTGGRIAIGETPRTRAIRQLHELVAALDRRVPQVAREGEVWIARSAVSLRAEAMRRIEELEREAAATASPVEDVR